MKCSNLMNIDVSIICPTYNSERTIKKLIDSILSQTYLCYELIIIDGGSKDQTLSIINNYKSSRIRFISEKDKGIYDAMNKGVALSKGKWLYFIGSDDYLENPLVLNNIFNRMTADDIIVGEVYEGQKLRKYRFSKKLYLENTVCHQAVFYSSSIFRDFKYNINYKISADYELNLYVMTKRLSIHYVNVPVCYSCREGISCKVNFNSYHEEIEIRDKFIHNSIIKKLLVIYSITRFCIRKVLNL